MGNIIIPKSTQKLSKYIDCSWKIIGGKGESMRVDINFKKDKICDCDCANVTITVGNNGKPLTFCVRKLPFERKATFIIVRYRGRNEGKGGLLSNVIGKYYYDKFNSRVIRSSETSGGESSASSDEVESTKKPKGDEEKKNTAPKILILASALPTIFIFVACVAAIAYRNYYQETHYSYSG